MTRAGALAILVWATFLGAAGHWLSRHLVVTTDVSAFLPAAVSPGAGAASPPSCAKASRRG